MYCLKKKKIMLFYHYYRSSSCNNKGTNGVSNLVHSVDLIESEVMDQKYI